MTWSKEKRIAYCPQCHKQTAWLYVNGVKTFWLCLLCATREESPRQAPPDRHSVQDLVQATTAAVCETLADAHAVCDQARQLLHQSDEVLQHRRARTERQGEHHRHPGSAQTPPPHPQPSDGASITDGHAHLA